MKNNFLGTTFCENYCNFLKLDAKDVLDKIITLHINPVRIGVYWDEVEYEPEFRYQSNKNNFDFKHFDWIIEKLDKNNIDIILAVGAKVPRWPEFHLPDFIQEKYDFKKGEAINNPFLLAETKRYIGETIKRYKNIKSIKWIQVENEPYEPFGPNKWIIHPEFLAQEIHYVKSLCKLPIILTGGGMDPIPPWIGNIYGKFERTYKLLEQDSDIIGLDVYPVIPHEFLWKMRYFRANEANWKNLEKIKHEIEAHNKRVWITELQAEPWEAGKMNTKSANANESCNPNLVCAYLKKSQEIGFEKILLWGSEFWLACEKDRNTAWVNNLKGFFLR